MLIVKFDRPTNFATFSQTLKVADIGHWHSSNYPCQWSKICLSAFPVTSGSSQDDVIKWKHFPRYWPFVRGIHRSPVNPPHKVQWRGALMFSLICVWIYGWVNNREAGDLRRYRAHYDVTVMLCPRNKICDSVLIMAAGTSCHGNATGLKLENFYFFTFTFSRPEVRKLLRIYFFTFSRPEVRKLFRIYVFTFSLWIANSLELLQYCTTPSKYGIIFQLQVEKK